MKKKLSNMRARADNKVRVRTAKGRKLSSTLWLQRQLNDPYTLEAKRLGWRSRSAFKLIEMDEKFSLLQKAEIIVDLGSAPGGWLQVASKSKPKQLIGIDLLEHDSVEGATLIQQDFLEDEGLQALETELNGAKVDLLLSDMAANAIGHYGTDRLRNMLLAEVAADFAFSVLAQGGDFVCKVFGSANEGDLLTKLKQRFAKVRHYKPSASRKESPEIYVVAQGYRGIKND